MVMGMVCDWNFDHAIAFEEAEPQAIQKCKTANWWILSQSQQASYFLFLYSGFIFAAELRLDFDTELSSLHPFTSVLFSFEYVSTCIFYYRYVIEQYV